jgi:hypothetical protein
MSAKAGMPSGPGELTTAGGNGPSMPGTAKGTLASDKAAEVPRVAGMRNTAAKDRTAESPGGDLTLTTRLGATARRPPIPTAQLRPNQMLVYTLRE